MAALINQFAVQSDTSVDVATTPYQVLSSVADTTSTKICFVYINLEPLTGTAGVLTLDCTIGGFTNGNISGAYYFTADTNVRIETKHFIVRANETVVITAQSDQAGDTSVNVTTYLMDATPLQV